MCKDTSMILQIYQILSIDSTVERHNTVYGWMDRGKGCRHGGTHKCWNENRKTSRQALVFSSFSPASPTFSNDKPPLTFLPPVKRVVVTSKVPLPGLELNLSKCFSLMFFADWL